MNKDIILTITMLVSNREDTIEKCMKSLVHLREAVSSELIVVDTAGNETCMDIVRQYTDKIIPFKWCDDFSAARNAGVEKAQGQWLMYLDDDEWFESTEELEDFFLSGKYREYCSAAYKVRDYYDLTGTCWEDMDVVRLTKRKEGTRFVRKIHEQFFPLSSPTCYLNDYVHHYGYVFGSQQEESKHSQRNIRLLLEQRKEDPQDPQTTAQLIQEYCVAEEYFSAIELCKELWPMEDAWEATVRARYATYAAVAELKAYIMQKRYTDGYEAGKKMLAFLNQKDNSILARGVVYNLMTELCYQLKKYDEVLEYIDRFNACKKEWDKYPEHQSLDPFSDCALLMSDKEADRLSLLKLHLYILQDEWEKAKEVLLSIDWQKDELPFLPYTPKDVTALIKRIPYHLAKRTVPAKGTIPVEEIVPAKGAVPVEGAVLAENESGSSVYISAYLPAINAIYRREDMRPHIYAAIDESKSEEKEVLMAYLHQITPADVRMCVYHLIYAGNQGDLDAAVPVLEKMQEENFPFFLEDEAYWDSLRKLGVNINQYMASLGIYRWTETAKRLWDVVELDVCEKIYPCLIRGLEKTDLRYLYVSALLMEKKLLEKEKILSGKDDSLKAMYPASEIWIELYQMSQYWVACAAMLYREDVFISDMIKALPPCYQFGWYIMQANAVKESNASLFVHKVADAAKAYPALKELCKTAMQLSSDT